MADQMAQGLTLMVLGMGMVFAFLGVLVVAVSALARLAPKPTPATPSDGASAAGDASATDAEVLGAITAAVAAHRSRKPS